MYLQHADKTKWIKEISADPIENFGKNARSKLRATLDRIAEYNIACVVRELDDDFLGWFMPLYQAHISRKHNPKIFNIRETTLENTSHSFPYFSLALLENNKPIGGTIFSVREDNVSIAYRTYQNKWNNAPLPANPSQYAEYKTAKHVVSLGKTKLSHGKDRNPYGLNANIGLAIFKLSVGCAPILPEKYEIYDLDTTTLKRDVLILLLPQKGTHIKTAYLFTTPEKESGYSQLQKYPDRLEVVVKHRN